MRFWGKVLFLIMAFSHTGHTQITQCIQLLSSSSRVTNILSVQSFGGSLATYEDLKLNPMWNHPQRSFHDSVVQSFIEHSREASAVTLLKIMRDLKESDKISLLEQALTILESDDPDITEFSRIHSLLTKKHDVLLDFNLGNSPRLTRFALGSQILIKSLEDLRHRLEKLYAEQEKLSDLFELVSLNADSTIRTQRFEDPTTVHLRPVPEEVVLLVYAIRGGYFDLFVDLTQSPQILGQLHLDYSVKLLDEIQRLPSEVRAKYNQFAHETFSAEAQEKYNQGLRGSDGTTMWDKIPLGTY